MEELKKIVIATDKDAQQVAEKALRKEAHLEDWVLFVPSQPKSDAREKEESASPLLTLSGESISFAPDWNPEHPPLQWGYWDAWNEDLFLGWIYFQIGNLSKGAYFLSRIDKALSILEWSEDLKNGGMIGGNNLQQLFEANGDTYADLHNLAILLHYGATGHSLQSIEAIYRRAIDAAQSIEQKAYTAYHLSCFLLDTGKPDQASQEILDFTQQNTLSKEGRSSIQRLWISGEIKTNRAANNPVLARKLEETLENCKLNLNENSPIERGFLLLDEAALKVQTGQYASALSSLREARQLFEKEGLEELAAQATFEKAKILYTWGQDNQPHLFREAMKSCQSALKTFNRENYAEIFADIHHLLALIYAEIQDEAKKKHIWAAVSVSSFQEALAHYSKEEYPYQYGLICNNQGNAYTKYPISLRTDNYAKALEWYREALSVRDASAYPAERAVTLLNFLEAAWRADSGKDAGQALFQEMLAAVEEIMNLPVDQELKKMGQQHKDQLKEIDTPSGEEVNIH